MTGASTSGTARLQVYGNGIIDLKAHRPGNVTFGSLQGDGRVQLGGVNLVLGEGDFDSIFSGFIRDMSGGSLTKTGAGTVTLTRANTYAGGTSVNAGALKISNPSGSGTGPGTVNVNSGTLGGSGIISGAVIIGTGSGDGAFLAPSVAATEPKTLTLRNSLTFNSDSTFIGRLNTKEARIDQVVANGVMIENGAEFGLGAVGNKKLRPGKTFTAINNTATTAIGGAFANLPDGGTITVGINIFEASYEGGDGNDLILTVVP
jgi:autotransporter-associated beta strand protein